MGTVVAILIIWALVSLSMSIGIAHKEAKRDLEYWQKSLKPEDLKQNLNHKEK
jgi:hypothetical protein